MLTGAAVLAVQQFDGIRKYMVAAGNLQIVVEFEFFKAFPFEGSGFRKTVSHAFKRLGLT